MSNENEIEWNNKILLITGASKGIGANVVRLALQEGVQQAYNLDIDVNNGLALQQELNEKYSRDLVKFVECDVTNEETLKTNLHLLLGEKNDDYVLINNAGIYDDSMQNVKKQIDTNVTALIKGSLIALDLMRKDNGGNGGTIINVSSTSALHPSLLTPIYNATNSAILTFSMGLGSDNYYKRSGVRVLTICVGLTDTDLVTLKKRELFDNEIENRLMEPFSEHPCQSAESAARGIIDMFKHGASASVWLSNNSKPVQDITDKVRKAYGVMSEPFFK